MRKSATHFELIPYFSFSTFYFQVALPPLLQVLSHPTCKQDQSSVRRPHTREPHTRRCPGQCPGSRFSDRRNELYRVRASSARVPSEEAVSLPGRHRDDIGSDTGRNDGRAADGPLS